MIGAFARLLGSRERVLHCEETGDNAYTVKTRGPEGDEHAEAADTPPEQFVERFPHEGGDVFLAPMLEALRAVLRGKKPEREGEPEPRDASTIAPER